MEPTPTGDANISDAGSPDVTKRPSDAGIDVDSLALPPESSESIDLGLHAGDASFSFAVPVNTLGFQLVVRGDEDATVRVEVLRTPSGADLFTAGSPLGTVQITAEGKQWSAAAIPQPDVFRKTPVEPGTWTSKVSATSGRSRVWLTLQRTGDGLFHGGELDLHVYVPRGLVLSTPGPSHVVDPANAGSDEALLARID